MTRIFRPLWWVNLLTLMDRSEYRGYRGEASDSFDGERFNNLTPRQRPVQRRRFGLLRWQLASHKRRWQWQHNPPADPVPARVEGEALRVTFINHASLLIQTQGLNILTDPIWSQRCSPFSFIGPKRHHAPGLSFDQLPEIDLILVSHGHYDHLDLGTLRRLAERYPRARVITGLGNAELIRGETGFSRIDELDWWQSLPLDNGVQLHGVPMQHWSARSRYDNNRTLWLGFMLTAPGGPVLFPGDTAWGRHFELIRQRFGPLRFAALSIGAYKPEWMMSGSHLNPAEAVQAHRALASRHSLGIHFGCFPLSDEGQFAPLQDLATERRRQGVADDAFRVLAPGAAWDVPILATAGRREPVEHDA